MKMNLQLFAEAVQGKRIVYLFRPISKAGTAAAAVMALVSENERSKSKDSDTVVTKDGTIRVPGAPEIEISATALVAKGDPMIDELEEAMDNDEIIEIWEANLDEPVEGGQNKFKGAYYQAYLTELTLSSSAEDHAEYETTFAVNGKGAKGEVTVTAEQQAVADYAFKDTTKGA